MWYPYVYIKRINSFEFFVLLSISCLVLCLMLQANDFLAFYVALELQSLCFYALASFKRDSAFSVEAGFKYFVLGAISSGIFLSELEEDRREFQLSPWSQVGFFCEFLVNRPNFF